MYQPYPGQTQLPEAQRPPAPAPVRNAAKACLAGKNWARIWGILVWLVGLTAIVFLRQRASTAFFKATPFEHNTRA
jgi:hypothetical protein